MRGRMRCRSSSPGMSRAVAGRSAHAVLEMHDEVRVLAEVGVPVATPRSAAEKPVFAYLVEPDFEPVGLSGARAVCRDLDRADRSACVRSEVESSSDLVIHFSPSWSDARDGVCRRR
jgi:hypothetical protein